MTDQTDQCTECGLSESSFRDELIRSKTIAVSANATPVPIVPIVAAPLITYPLFWWSHYTFDVLNLGKSTAIFAALVVGSSVVFIFGVALGAACSRRLSRFKRFGTVFGIGRTLLRLQHSPLRRRLQFFLVYLLAFDSFVLFFDLTRLFQSPSPILMGIIDAGFLLSMAFMGLTTGARNLIFHTPDENVSDGSLSA